MEEPEPASPTAEQAPASAVSKGKGKGKAKGPPALKGRNSNAKMAPRTGLFALSDPIPEWYEEDGLRKVKPYMYAFHSWAKERWHGRTLIDVYGEFRDRSTAYYEWAIETGAIVVNNEISTPQTILRNGDLISNVLHRHEPPVAAGPVKIIYDGRLPGNDGQTFVVEKPGSMPIHSTGRYHFNTLLSILKYDYDLPLVHTSNRLDRLTSGVMICALTVEKSKSLGEWFGGRRAADGGVHKEYVARAMGRFPDGEIVCEEPLLTIDRQLGVNVVHADGRESKTIFERLSYHEGTNTSVVLCRPITGRSHQIRVHLQFLGHPIANDPVYQNQDAWGVNGGKGGIFGAERGGTADTRRLRREMGDKMLAEARAGGLIPPDSTDMAASIYNKRGGVKVGYLSAETTAALAESAEADGRLAYEAPLSEEAKKALGALRVAKDANDGWARERDVEGIQRARAADAKGLISERDEQARSQDSPPKPHAVGSDGMGFCPTCYTPLLADPKPDQLFIWLHALRYRTTEWDWHSEMPAWSLETWNG